MTRWVNGLTPDPTPTERLYAIVEQGLCIGCGLCQSVAGAERVRVCKTESGYEQPVVVGELDHDTVDRIYESCPGTRIEGLPERLLENDTKVDNVWGPWRRIVRAWASDPHIRHEGSTGGVMTALGQYLLETKRVEFILQVKASSTEPSFGESTLSFSDADVFEAVGSRYGPAAPLIEIDDVLARGQPFAFFAKPCDVAALRNYARQQPRVDELLRYCVVMVCGGYGTPQGTVEFFRRSGIDPDAVTALRYRGRGCPGPTRIETDDGAVHEFHYIDYWGEDETTWSLPFRCKICPDGIGEAADLAASDTWIGGGPNRIDSETDPGVNGVIARTRAGEAIATLVGTERGDDLRDLGVKAWHTMSGYLRGVAITGVVDAVIIGIGLALLGVPLVVPLMLLIFAGAFIPLVGATAAGILAAMVALVSGGPGTALAVGALVLVVQQIEGDVLAPLVLGRAVRLHAVTILLSLTAGSVVAGIIGAFLAVPLAAVVKTVVEHYRPPLAAALD